MGPPVLWGTFKICNCEQAKIIVKGKLYPKLGFDHSFMCGYHSFTRGYHSLTRNRTIIFSESEGQERLAMALKIIVKRKLYTKLGFDHSLTCNRTFIFSESEG